MTVFNTAEVKKSLLYFPKGGGAYGESRTQGASGAKVTRECAIDESDRESYAARS
jgi:hypothetical protein